MLQEYLQELEYGKVLTSDEQRRVLPLLADVQARALEAVEKLLWEEMLLCDEAELLYSDETHLKSYAAPTEASVP
jgi:hypothetical protein